MNDLELCLNGFCLSGQGIMHIFFVCRLTGKKQKVRYFAVYLFLLGIMECVCSQFAVSEVWAIGAELLVLYGMSRCALGNLNSVSWVSAVLAVYLSQFSFGIINSAESIIFPGLIGSWLLYPLLFLAILAAFAVCAGCYAAALKFLSLEDGGQSPYAGMLLFPGLFFFAAELYILHTSYRVASMSLSAEEIGKHGALLFLQALGLGAMLSTLYAYQRLCRGLRTQAVLQSLAQAAQAQKIYIAEAQMRYGQTRAFRHDIKNHLSVLNGLLESGKLDESKAYLEKLETVSAGLSFPCQTGNPVVDILLSEKLGLAEMSGIRAEVSLALPKSCGIDDFDLCVIFANALDNAIDACRSAKGEKSIRVGGQRQGDFYLLTFENTCLDGPMPPMGIGLSNIKSAAEKYQGTMLTQKAGCRFSLNVLLNSSCYCSRDTHEQ